MKFRTTIVSGTKKTTGILVPPEVVDKLGAGKKPKVTVTVGKHTYRSSIASMGGEFLISLSAENRALAEVDAGDEVEVGLELDTAKREVTVPPALAEALAAEPAAKQFFESLSYSNQLWHVLQVDGAKTEETRQRRVQKTLTTMREKRAR